MRIGSSVARRLFGMKECLAGKRRFDMSVMSNFWKSYPVECVRVFAVLVLIVVTAAVAFAGGVSSEIQSSTGSPLVTHACIISDKEEQLLKELWTATIRNSPAAQVLIEQTFHQRDEKDDLKLLVVIDDVIADMRRQPFGGALTSLTDANLEPSYPAAGGQAASYLLPKHARENPSPLYRQYSVASKFQNVVSSSGRSEKTLQDLANELIVLYCRYRDCSKMLTDVQAHAHANSRSNNDLLAQHLEQCREQLVILVGTQAMDRLDQQFGIRR
jgi:hypothetical protein